MLGKAIVILPLFALLGGCMTNTVYVDRVVEVRPTIAPSLLRCLAEPEPLVTTARLREVAPYVVSLARAGADCRRKLTTVRRQVEQPAPATESGVGSAWPPPSSTSSPSPTPSPDGKSGGPSL